jgi:phenylalanyl-tRNA synthetase beta chain
VIRGVESDGMCCALYELGVDKKYLNEKQCDGIEELPEDAEVGDTEVLKYLGLDDAVLDLKLLANRPDLNAMQNVAYEVGCLLSRPVLSESKEVKDKKPISFKVGSLTEKCPQFAIRVIEGVKVGPSPLWLQRILTSEGVRSINNVVDIGNYVMLLTGQPINMYDLDKLPAKELIVRDDYEGDFLAMDEKNYSLIKGDLLVTSKGQGMCLAGIMTSKACAVDETSHSIALEVATFHGASIRHTSNRLGLASESSSRFVKGINSDQVESVMEIASSLLVELASASSVSTTSSYDTLKHEKQQIATSLSYINGRLGTTFSLDEVKEVLTRDHLPLTEVKGDHFVVNVPSYRIDMAGEADVSEEVIRLLGYSHVTSRLPEVSYSISGGLTPEQKNKLAIRRYLRSQGVYEGITYSLIDAKHVDSFAYLNKGACYKLMNPMTPDHEYLRKNLLHSLLAVASYNYAHQEKNLALFEVSDLDGVGMQSTHLAIVLVGEEERQGSLLTRPYDYYSVKGLFEGIMHLLDLSENRYKLVPLSDPKDEFHPGRSAEILVGKQRLAVFGELHPTALKAYDLGKNAVALELDLGALLAMKTSPEKASIPPKFPSISRDLAFVLPSEVSYEDVRREIARSDKLIAKVEIFDLYAGANIAAGKKSMALRLSFLDPEKTLKDEEVAAVMEKIVGTLRMRFNAEIRS